jgi:hypothetical protein
MRSAIFLSFSVCCSSVFSPPASAQHQGRSALGLKAAVQWSTQRAPGISYRSVPGGAFGIYLPLWCGNRFELQPELLLSAQGASIPNDESDALLLRTIYAQVPFSAKLYLSNTINAQFGLYGATLLSARLNGEDVRTRYNGFDFGFNGGLGLDFSSGFDLALRYSMGHTPVLSADVGVFPKNQLAHLAFGYRVARISHGKSRK